MINFKIIYHHACDDAPVPLFSETRNGHTDVMTKEQWEEIRQCLQMLNRN